jgi:hypothetical protein
MLPDIAGGYLCFVVSIMCIGVVTAIIGDVASHFGCTLGIKDSVTAIVFVALGTSIPGQFFLIGYVCTWDNCRHSDYNYLKSLKNISLSEHISRYGSLKNDRVRHLSDGFAESYLNRVSTLKIIFRH